MARVRSVCHIIGNLNYGGAERHFVDLLNELDISDKFALILTDERGGLEHELSSQVSTRHTVVKLSTLPASISRLSKILEDISPQIVHTHMFWPNLFGTIAAKRARIPIVLTCEHGKNPWKKWHHGWLERHIITPRSDARVCVSRDILELRRDSDGISPDRLVYIPNGTRLRTLQDKSPGEPPVIGSVGRLVPAKGYEWLMQACHHLRSQNIDFRLRIAGDGPDRQRLESLCRDLGIQEFCRIEGFTSDVAGFLDGLDVFALPSVREGMPVALLEAMAAKLPIVSTNVGGIPDVLTDGVDGLLVPPSDSRALAGALRRIILDRGLARSLSRNALARVARKYSIERVSRDYLSLYSDLLDRHDLCG